MADIKDSVGEAATNKSHDVALLQAMLCVVKNAKGQPYLTGYDGSYGPNTKQAIIDFQVDQKLVEPPAKPGAVAAPPAPPGPASVPNAGAPAAKPTEKLAFVDKASVTYQKLAAALPATHKDMQIIENTKTVYMPASAGDMAQSKADMLAAVDVIDPAFRSGVAGFIEQVFQTHKVVLSLTKSGQRRPFADQLKVVTKAGPGESNHNYGQAADIGFNNFQWVKGDGTFVSDDWWLNRLNKNEGYDQVVKKGDSPKSQALWKAVRVIATATPAVFLIGDWDPGHLQSYDQSTVSAARSLAALLNAVGKMKWKGVAGTPNTYECDLGLGGALYPVGSAKDVWTGAAQVTKTLLATAMSAAQSKPGKPVVVKVTDIKDAEVTATKTVLKTDFETADTKWKSWKPTP